LSFRLDLAVFFITVVADQASKFFVRLSLASSESHVLIPGFLYLTYSTNQGAAFGLFGGSQPWILASSVLLISVTFLWYIRTRTRTDQKPVALGLVLVMAGAMGNLVDRVRLGYVVDFIDFRVWPIFNLADCAITAGAVLVLSSLVLRGRKS